MVLPLCPGAPIVRALLAENSIRERKRESRSASLNQLSPCIIEGVLQPVLVLRYPVPLLLEMVIQAGTLPNTMRELHLLRMR